MTIAAQLREIRRSVSCKWFPVSAPRPIMKGTCVKRTYFLAPSGEITSRTASLCTRVSVMPSDLTPPPTQPRIVTRSRAIRASSCGHTRLACPSALTGEPPDILPACCESPLHVVHHKSVQRRIQLPGDRPGAAAPNGPSGDFRHPDDISVRRGDQHFIGGVQIFQAQHLFHHGGSRFRGHFGQHPARYPFQTARVERRRQNL